MTEGFVAKLDLHCNIDEDVFSLAVFLTRLLTGLVLLYITVGSLLFYREFLYNAAALGLPLPVPLGLTILVVELFLALLLILGWFTRPAALAAWMGTVIMGFIFFASDLNNNVRTGKNQFRLQTRRAPRTEITQRLAYGNV